ncbi:Eco57I restriction-modification methylase domain-containing protein [Bacteroidota bacterium]
MNYQEINEAHLDLMASETIKRNGVVYTPEWIADYITKNACQQWKKYNKSKTYPQSAADFCCGTGVFLNSLDNVIKKEGWGTEITGIDIDQKALDIAKERNSEVSLIHRDILLDTLDEQPKYDVIVSNPPYVSSSIIEKKYKETLKKNYISTKGGSFDLSVVFIEKIINSLKPNGVASIILSNKFMTTKYGKGICEYLSANTNLIKIEDFNDSQLFKEVVTYTCIITFMKTAPSKRFTIKRFLEEIKPTDEKFPNFIEETIDSKKLLSHPWKFVSRLEDEILIACNKSYFKNIEEHLGTIKQGVRTGFNEAFITKVIEKSEMMIYKKFVNGEDLKDLLVNDTKKAIIFPYETIGNTIRVIHEDVFREKYPITFQKIKSHSYKLNQRSMQAGTEWFEFGRRQSLDIGSQKKILIREMMPSALFTADISGDYIFSSGYAIECNSIQNDEILAWSFVLSTPIMEFLMRHIGTQLHSGWFRLMKHHLKNLKLPPISSAELAEIYSVFEIKGFKGGVSLVNQLVARAFGLTNKQLSFIEEYIKVEHKKSTPNSRTDKNESKYEPVKLSKYDKFHITKDSLRSHVTFSPNKKTPIHSWYKYTQGFSSELVNYLLSKEFSANENSIILDPFNGCGTTTTFCAYNGLKSIGVEISPLMCEVAKIKARKWNINKLKMVVDNVDSELRRFDTKQKLTRHKVFSDYFDKAYSVNILKQLDKIADYIKVANDLETTQFLRMGLLSILEDVSKIRKHGSHYRFLDNAASVGLQKLNIDVIDEDADIFSVYKQKLFSFYMDICSIGNADSKPSIVNGSALKMKLDNDSVDFVVTSPPYLNRNNYIAQQKAELDILELIETKEEYKKLVKSSFRSHTDAELNPDCKSRFREVNLIINNLSLEKGNNPKIPNMISGYFDDLFTSLLEVYRVLKKGGQAAFVLGNTRWGGVVVPIDHILCKFSEEIGFEIDKILVTRLKGNSPQQMKKFGRIPVRESIVLISKKGKN